MQHPNTLLIWFSVITLIWFTVLALIQWLRILEMILGKSSRQYRTILTEDGIIQITADKTTVNPWNTISEIRQHNGHVYFWLVQKTYGFWVPSTAFLDSAAAQYFADAGMAAKSGDYSLLNKSLADTSQTSDATDVWPPPPQRGINSNSAS